MSVTRRRFLGLLGGAVVAVRQGWAATAPAFEKAEGMIVIVGVVTPAQPAPAICVAMAQTSRWWIQPVDAT